MSAVKEKIAPNTSDTTSGETEKLPKFDVTNVGSLHIPVDKLIESAAAQRQLDAVERLSKKKNETK